ncbi:hypothetical protein PAXRUDRAFT_151383 [Paxillus rubicundulus Ve08.2h10]|uniref:Uncharacterized protein n=1 Tax=Paxillus rubicundulus Ve08.2h10 TaxID=930991 RepID=A0A0D0E1V5_9AGAM|nr:hypothetical protein PAXRUDRAFT_151383 [Paxillus rubicundulus Ve08.2h10]
MCISTLQARNPAASHPTATPYSHSSSSHTLSQPSHSHQCQPSFAKRAALPSYETPHTNHKHSWSFRSGERTNPNEPLPTCAICIGIDPHTMPIVECPAEKMWDGKHETFSKRSNHTLITKATGQHICTHWQQRNGCSE